jgi:hypothetical protein
MLLALVAAVTALMTASVANAAVTSTKDAAAGTQAIADPIPTDLQGAGSFTNYGKADCENGDDDDGDGETDTADPDCESPADDLEDTAVGNSAPECQDLVDNDGDNLIDTADAGGCASATDADESTAGDQQTECETGTDDDGDADGGAFGSDPDCSSPNDDNESSNESCSDNDDNDEDGAVDTADSDCAFPYDEVEGPSTGSFAPAALVDTPVAGFPTAGSSYLALSSGSATGLVTDLGGGDNNGVDDGGHGTEVHDLVTLRVDLNAPQSVDCLGFDFRFLTTEDVGDSYDDSFVAELDGSDFTTDGSGTVTAAKNIAKDPTGNVIGVNSTPLTDFPTDSVGIFDRGTPTYRATSAITPGAHTLFLSVWDDSDSSADSAALVDNLFFGNASGGTCNARDLFPPETTIGKHPKDKTTKKKVKFTFDSNEENVTFECKLDKKDYKPCDAKEKFKAKKKGKHKLKVRAVDAAGNVDPTPDKDSWKKKEKERK